MKGKISLEDLVEQFLDQCRSGNVPDIQDFAGAHPEFAAELLALLPLVMEMEDWSVEKKQGIMPPVHDFPDLEGDDYRLIRRLGSGGMGVVFEALQLSLNRKVAVKLLSPLLLQDAAQRIQFEHEAHVIARLHHPNIVRIFSAACRPGCCYYAMELIEGKSLDGCEFSNPYEIDPCSVTFAARFFRRLVEYFVKLDRFPFRLFQKAGFLFRGFPGARHDFTPQVVVFVHFLHIGRGVVQGWEVVAVDE